MPHDPHNLGAFFREVPDFPKPGILFRNIEPLLGAPWALREAIDSMVLNWKGQNIDVIAGLDARGFIFGSLLAFRLGVPFIMIRKKGKLPGKVESIDYGLEYGSAVFEVSTESLPEGKRVLVVDDLLATGGSAKAAATLLERVGYEIAGYAFIAELEELKGRETLKDARVTSVIAW